MAKILSPPSTRKTTTRAILEIAILNPGNRTPTTVTIIVGVSFNSNIDPGNIILKSNTPVFLSAGTKLTFSGIIIDIAEEITVNTSNTTIPIIDLPPGIIIAVNSTTLKIPSYIVHGCKNCNINPEIQTIETTNVSHGAEKEEKQTFNSKKISIDIVETYNDFGGHYLSELCHNLTYRNYEFWFRHSYPDGSFKQGVAIVTNANYNTNIQSIKSFRLEGRVQPGTYSFNNVI